MRTLLVCLGILSAASSSAQTVLVGDPAALVQTTGSITFDPAAGAATIPQHGYFDVRITTRTIYDNRCVLDDQAWMPFWSNLDPSAPITAPPENKIMFATVADLTCPTNNAALFGQHVVEMREQAPLYNQLVGVSQIAAFGYNYQCCLPPGTYEVRVNPDLHMGIDGALLPGTILDGQPLTSGGPPRPLGSGNLDTLDPSFLAAAPPKMGNAPGDVTLGLNWIVPVPDGFVDQWGGTEPKIRLDAWLNFNVHLNPVAQPAIGADVWTLHDNPWGVTSVAKDACPKPDFQAHYGATSDLETALNPALSHTHINPTVCPYSEVKGGDQVTIPFTLKLYHTAGQIILVQAHFMGPGGEIPIPVSIGTVVPPPPPPPPVPTIVTVPVIGQLVNGVPQILLQMPDGTLKCMVGC